MGITTTRGTIRRITVALDCSPHSRATLDAAAAIAGALHAELSGIFVEDINLIHMAELPFSEEILVNTAKSRQLDAAGVARQMKLQQKQALELLRQTAERFGIPHSFRTLRGRVSTEIISAALESDLLALGRSGRTPSCRRGLGSTAKQAVIESKTHILLSLRGFRSASPLLVLYDGSQAARLALETALRIAASNGILHVLLLAGNEPKAARLRREAETITKESGKTIEFHVIPWNDSTMLSQCIRMIDSGMVVLGEEMEAVDDTTVLGLIENLSCPLLLLRQRPRALRRA